MHWFCRKKYDHWYVRVSGSHDVLEHEFKLHLLRRGKKQTQNTSFPRGVIGTWFCLSATLTINSGCWEFNQLCPPRGLGNSHSWLERVAAGGRWCHPLLTKLSHKLTGSPCVSWKHFLKGQTQDFNCYHPANMQTRYFAAERSDVNFNAYVRETIVTGQ